MAQVNDELDNYTDTILPILIDPTTNEISSETLKEFFLVHMFLDNIDVSFYNNAKTNSNYPTIQDNHKEQLKTLFLDYSMTDKGQLMTPITEVGSADMTELFNKLNISGDPAILKENIKKVLNLPDMNNIIDQKVITTVEDFSDLLFELREVTAKKPPTSDEVAEEGMTDVFNFVAYKSGDDIKILAENKPVTKEIIEELEKKSMVISNKNPDLDKIAQTLLRKQNFLNKEFSQFSNRSIESLTDKFVSPQDPVLGTGWTTAFRSPVFELSEFLLPDETSPSKEIPIKYYNRDFINSKDENGDIKLYSKANKFYNDLTEVVSLSKLRRLDDFIRNVQEIAKIDLQRGDPIYMIGYEQVPFIKTNDIKTSNQCQYMKIKLTYKDFDPETDLISNTRTVSKCFSGLWTGPVYRPRFDEMIKYMVEKPTLDSSQSPAIFGGANNTRKYSGRSTYYTRHRKPRTTRANLKRKRYNKTRRW